MISSRVAFSLFTRIQLLTAFSTFFASACKMALVTRQLQQKAREMNAAVSAALAVVREQGRQSSEKDAVIADLQKEVEAE